ncbi:DUF4190 domain-containing protein [Micromonospora sp. NPDC049679]|uniref:DUF4190 domain-containing protein n=1 Tax=Micromonospora sp. NPDC049679 TaxID=3155920 RepID=UPI00340214B1
MTNPEQPGNWSDPSWPAQQPTGSPDPTYPMAAQPVTDQPGSQQQPQNYQPQNYQPVAEQQMLGQPASTQQFGQPGYGAPFSGPEGYPAPAPGYPPYGYPVMAAPPTNGLSIASMVVSIIAVMGLCGYGIGGYIGIVGAILGHVSRRQIRSREQVGQPEAGAGMALAGIIMGWIATVIAVLATVAIVVFAVWLSNQDPSTSYAD